MILIPTDRSPTHPGEMLLEEFLNPMSLTQRELADAIHVPYQRINDIVHGRRRVTPSTALRLARFFNMLTDFWMNLQLRWDMYHAQQEDAAILKKKPASMYTLEHPISRSTIVVLAYN
jgi:addiction module HigA family antidote